MSLFTRIIEALISVYYSGEKTKEKDSNFSIDVNDEDLQVQLSEDYHIELIANLKMESNPDDEIEIKLK